MKKILITLLFVPIAFCSFGQTTPAKKTTTTTPAKKTTAAAPAAFTAKDSMLCKQWMFVSSEQFSVPLNTPAQKNDAMAFMIDKTVIFTMEGKKMTGTWLTDKPKTYLYITVDGTNEKLRMKIIKLEKQKLSLEYRDKDEFYTTYNYESAK